MQDKPIRLSTSGREGGLVRLARRMFQALPTIVQDEIRSYRHPRQAARRARERGLDRVIENYFQHHSLEVASGPFKGMKYIPEAAGSTLLPKLIGSYEAELHHTIQGMHPESYDYVLDVGCAEGYYAVGLALRLRTTIVYASDSDRRARRLCHQMGDLNGVSSRLRLVGRSTPDFVTQIAKRGQTLLICDCEGCEFELLAGLDSSHIGNLDLLIEFHDFENTKRIDNSLRRFHATHSCSVFHVTPRDPQDYPAVRCLGPRHAKEALNELRNPNQVWAFLKSSAGLESSRIGDRAITEPGESTF